MHCIRSPQFGQLDSTRIGVLLLPPGSPSAGYLSSYEDIVSTSRPVAALAQDGSPTSLRQALLPLVEEFAWNRTRGGSSSKHSRGPSLAAWHSRGPLEQQLSMAAAALPVWMLSCLPQMHHTGSRGPQMETIQQQQRGSNRGSTSSSGSPGTIS